MKANFRIEDSDGKLLATISLPLKHGTDALDAVHRHVVHSSICVYSIVEPECIEDFDLMTSIQKIKWIKDALGLGLREAKTAIDNYNLVQTALQSKFATPTVYVDDPADV